MDERRREEGEVVGGEEARREVRERVCLSLEGEGEGGARREEVDWEGGWVRERVRGEAVRETMGGEESVLRERKEKKS